MLYLIRVARKNGGSEAIGYVSAKSICRAAKKLKIRRSEASPTGYFFSLPSTQKIIFPIIDSLEKVGINSF